MAAAEFALLRATPSYLGVGAGGRDTDGEDDAAGHVRLEELLEVDMRGGAVVGVAKGQFSAGYQQGQENVGLEAHVGVLQHQVSGPTACLWRGNKQVLDSLTHTHTCEHTHGITIIHGQIHAYTYSITNVRYMHTYNITNIHERIYVYTQNTNIHTTTHDTPKQSLKRALRS